MRNSDGCAMQEALPKTTAICPDDRASASAVVGSAELLTDRQYEVLALLAGGYPMKAVARRLGITYRTLTFHKYRTMQKLGITTNAGLIAYGLARKNGSEEGTSSSA